MLRRVLLQWVRWTFRRAATRTVQCEIYARACAALATRYFDTWVHIAEESRSWRDRYRRAELLAESVQHDVLHRFFDCWSQLGERRARLHGAARRLARLNLARLGQQVFWRWQRRRRRREQVTRMVNAAESVAAQLARRCLLTWMRFTVRCQLTGPLLAHVTTAAARRAFVRWRDWLYRGAASREIELQNRLQLARRYYRLWVSWLARRVQAHYLEQCTLHAFLRGVLAKWAWQCELRKLDYSRQAIQLFDDYDY